jgi:hypothetical protein
VHYQVTATIVKTDDKGWKSTIGIPTFYLDENMLGIVSPEHAEKIAVDIINPTNDPSIVVNAYSVRCYS